MQGMVLLTCKIQVEWLTKLFVKDIKLQVLTGSSLMKKSSCDAGYDLLDVQRTSMALSRVYSGRTPIISGRDSGRTVKKKLVGCQ